MTDITVSAEVEAMHYAGEYLEKLLDELKNCFALGLRVEDIKDTFAEVLVPYPDISTHVTAALVDAALIAYENAD